MVGRIESDLPLLQLLSVLMDIPHFKRRGMRSDFPKNELEGVSLFVLSSILALSVCVFFSTKGAEDDVPTLFTWSITHGSA